MTIHHWVLPTKKNNFHPHVLKPVGLLVFLLIFVTVPFLYNVTSAKQVQVLGYATNISVSDLYSLTNQERAAKGLDALTLDSKLNSAATAKANHMFANDYWAHVAPDGTTPWSFIYASGYNYSVAGENLAKDFNTSSGAVAGWMASPTHRDNILNTSYSDIGFAVVNGVLLGSQTTLVVAMYGARVDPGSAPAPIQSTLVPQMTTTASPVARELSSNESGPVEGFTALAPVKVYIGLNWGQKVSILLICILTLLFVMKHTLIWRTSKKAARHIWLRAHPIGQGVVLTALLVVTLASGIGTVL